MPCANLTLRSDVPAATAQTALRQITVHCCCGPVPVLSATHARCVGQTNNQHPKEPRETSLEMGRFSAIQPTGSKTPVYAGGRTPAAECSRSAACEVFSSHSGLPSDGTVPCLRRIRSACPAAATPTRSASDKRLIAIGGGVMSTGSRHRGSLP